MIELKLLSFLFIKMTNVYDEDYFGKQSSALQFAA